MSILQVICPDIQGHDGGAGLGGGTLGTAPIADTVNLASAGHRASWKCVAGASGQSAIDILPPTTAFGNTWGIRWKQMFQALPGSVGASSFFCQTYSGGSPLAAMCCDNSNHVKLVAWPGGTQTDIGSVSVNPLVVGRWHVFDLTVTTPSSGNSTVTLSMDGNLVASASVALANSQIGEVGLGCTFNAGASGTITTNVADVMVWDSTGSSHNAIPSSIFQTFKLMLPVGDRASVADWHAGLTAEYGLYTCMDNTPPTGVASASATSTSQMTNATSSTTDSMSLALQAPVARGAGASDQFLAMTLVASIANSTTTARSIGISAGTPTISEVVVSTGAVVAGTWPTGWTTVNAGWTYAPTISALITQVMSIRKNAASTDQINVSLAGLLVEHIPATAGSGGAVVLRAHTGAWV